MKWGWLGMAMFVACTTGTPTGPGPLGEGKTLSGPPRLYLLHPSDAGLSFPMLSADGGWSLELDLGARNVHPQGVTLNFSFLDTLSRAAVMPVAPVGIDFDLESGECVKRGVDVPVVEPLLVQNKTVWMRVELVDKDGREAKTEVEVVVTEGPDGGALDASAGGAQMDGGVVDGGDG